MSEFWITRGLPGSGKSTWANEKLKEFSAPGGMIVERDRLRQEFLGLGLDKKGVGTDAEERMITKVQHERIRQGLRMGLNVIVSDTGLRDLVVRELIGIAEDEGAEVHIKDFRDMPLELAKERNDLRGDGRVPDHVMDNMYDRFVKGKNLSEIPQAFKLEKTKFDFDSVPKYVAPENGVPTYICDLDGTLASHEGIRSPYDVTKYREDAVHQDMVHTVRALHDTGNKIVIFTGRHRDHEEDVVWWLNHHNIPYDELVMRERPSVSDDEEKVMLFEKYIRGREDIKIIASFDDRNRVVNALRTAFNIRVYQVAPGDF